MKKRITVIRSFIIFMLLLLAAPVSAKAEDMQLYAQSAVLMDGDSGRILFGKNEQEVRAMASTTKIMTCILVLENTDPSDTAAASENAAMQPKVHLGVQKGETFYVKDLLYSLMLESHNDAAVILAEKTAGSVEAFAEKMNQKAEEIGCSDTHFVTPKMRAENTQRRLWILQESCVTASCSHRKGMNFLRSPAQKRMNFQM